MWFAGKCEPVCFSGQLNFFGRKGTAHETKNEAMEEAQQMNQVYADFVENFLAIPVIQGLKPLPNGLRGRNILYRSLNARWKTLKLELLIC